MSSQLSLTTTALNADRQCTANQPAARDSRRDGLLPQWLAVGEAAMHRSHFALRLRLGLLVLLVSQVRQGAWGLARQHSLHVAARSVHNRPNYWGLNVNLMEPRQW